MEYGFDDEGDIELLNDWADQLQGEAAPEPEREEDKAAMYLRRSVQDQRDVSIGRQLAECIDHCLRESIAYDVEQLLFVDRHRSGATMEGRSALDAMFDSAARGEFNVLVVEQVDRLTRNLLDALRIREKLATLNVRIHTAAGGELKYYELALRAEHAERERERILGLISDGKRKAAAAGRFLGRRKVYGYDHDPAARTWTINETEAAVLRDIFRWIDEDGLTVNGVAMRLHATGVQATSSRGWQRSTLATKNQREGILRNTLLKGVWSWRHRNVEPVEIALPHLEIIEPALFDRVMARIDARRRTRPIASPKQGLLRGLLRCGRCGGAMVDSKYKGDMRNIVCWSAHLGRCDEKSYLPTAVAERQVLLTIRDELLHDDRRTFWNALRLREWQVLDGRLDAIRAERTTEMRRIEERLDAYDAPTDDLAPAELAIWADDELALHKLRNEVDGLAMPPCIEIDEARSAALKAEIDNLLPRLPFVAETDEDVRLADVIRNLVTQVVITRLANRVEYGFRCLVGIADGSVPIVAAVEPGPDRWLEKIIGSSRNAWLKAPEAVLALHRAADAGAFAIPDEDWRRIAYLYEPLQLPMRDPRLFAEALIMLAATGLEHRLLPERYAFLTYHDTALVRRRGIWCETIRVLRRHRSPLLNGLDAERFGPLTARPRPSSGGVGRERL